MTVAELIAELQELDQSLVVKVFGFDETDPDNETYCVEATDVTVGFALDHNVTIS